jgi:RsmE family RNA methyltransferase
MNCLILESDFRLLDGSPKLEHIRKVLRTPEGGEIFAGTPDGKMFVCALRYENGGARLEPLREAPNPPRLPLALAVSFARPQIAQRILFEAACFGVEKLIFYPSSKGEADYAKSGLYARGEYREWLIKGAEQACGTLIPDFQIAGSLEEAADICACAPTRLAPDPYEASDTLKNALTLAAENAATPVSAIFGSERGFSNPERELLRANGFTLCSMGGRILRTDTAAIAAMSLASAIL